ncbi:MAG: dihydroorotate dehydrogenase electron transfer subunit [Chloroflexi bacterium]|nr:MAG: dihydroorotate dehydrogenase electron transfer subunit [Chloroflexota bacterium]
MNSPADTGIALAPIGFNPRGLPQVAEVRQVIAENARTKTFILDASVEATPGQFIMLWLPGFDEKPFSLANDDPVTITVARVGPFTTLLHQRQAGDRLWFRGPFGHGFEIAGQRLLLVGGGYGVAPMDFLARRALQHGCQITIAVGARTADELLFIRRFTELDVDLRLTTEDGSAGQRGLVTDVVEPVLAAGQVDTLYACGPHGMLIALDRLCQEYGVPAQLSWEAYMRCGIGLCGSCEHDGLLLCVDGPVLAGGAVRPTRPAIS